MSPTEPTSRRTTLLVTAISSFLTPFMGSSVNVALPSIGKALSLDAVALGWVPGSALLAAAMVLLPCGRLSDIIGRKRVFVAGLLVYGAGAVAAGLSGSVRGLLAAQAVEGIGAGMIFGTGVALLTSAYPPGERGKVLGINVAAVYSGLALGPYVGGVLTAHLGWRSVFLAVAPVAVATAALAAARLRAEVPERRGEGFDAAGAVLYAAALAALMFGLSHLPGPTPLLLLIGGLIGLAGFAMRQRRAVSPLLDVRLLWANRVFALSNLAALINYSATAAATFLLSLYLQHVRGLAPQEAGTVLLLQPVVQAALSPLAGRLSDRLEPRVIASAGMALTAVGLGLLTSLGPQTAHHFVPGCLALLGLGFALFSSPNTNAIMGAVERKDYGVASATMGTMRLTGQMLSMAVVMMMLSAYLGPEPISEANLDAFLRCVRTSFGVFALLCAAGIIASRARGKMR